MTEKPIILAVDDTSESLALLTSILTPAGYQVRPADSGELALAAVAVKHPDLILLDLRMKGIGGLEACRRIKARKETRHIPIILMSAFAEVKEWVEGLELGAVDYITKPFQSEELLARVRTHLSLGRANDSLEQQRASLRETNDHLQSEIHERRRAEDELRAALVRAERSRLAMLGAMEDQQRTEEALRRSEQGYRLLFEANPHPMWIYELDSLGFLAVNDAAVYQYGYTREAFLRMSIREIRPSEDLPDLMDRLTDPSTIIRDPGILRHLKKNGEIILVEVLSHPMSWMGRAARVVVAHDVTQRERSQRELQSSEVNLKATFDQALVGMAQVGFDQRIFRVNQRFAEIVGRDSSQLVGMDISSLTHPEDQLPPEASIQDILRGMGGGLIQEKRYLKPDGTPVWIQLLESIVSTGDSDPDYILKVVEDITDRKRMEGEIQEMNRDLERRVEQRTQQLEAANQELEAFAYSVSHDLRAPIRTISGFSDALKRDELSTLSPAGIEHVQRIQGGATRMSQLIEDLLQLSRVGRDDCDMISIDLGSLVEQVLIKLKEPDPGRELTWQVDRPIRVMGNPSLLRILLENLLGNAWKFTAHTADARVWVTSRTVNDSSVEVTIRDNGAGFVSSQAGRLFTPFQRLHKPDDFPGTGIGLAIAKRIVSRHGGTIKAEGVPGIGAAFSFTLPRVREGRS